VTAKDLVDVKRRFRNALMALTCCLAIAISLDAQAPAGSTDDRWRIPSTDAIRALLAERMRMTASASSSE